MIKVHQEFFRYFMTSEICSKDVALSVLEELCLASNESVQPLNECIEAVNSLIKCYDLEIVGGSSELNGKEFIALVQISESNICESAKFDDKKTSALFAKVLSKIVLSGTGFIPEISCVNLNNDVEMSKKATELALNDFQAGKWLEVQSGNIYLGVRALLELGQLLSTNYPDAVQTCSLCRNNIFYGISCSHCQEKVHIHCIKKYLERSKTCPSCNQDWTQPLPSEDNSRSSEGGPSKPKRARLILDESSDSDS